ncbi:rhodanese-like domain-containing protein [Roseateles toxinivorans]|uniref:Membrane protein DedA with SNARE-associated domain n=1 Tax=Roseateles toxinivorans TaxID=270368 RepID=A0A4R6QTR1_9BURK|nr:VTT domain-containing protein [Roseateles toxinivorans]TDP74787.1 membrane protein DedA with SNARE-associated domain [Roseateles toxinivorans]
MDHLIALLIEHGVGLVLLVTLAARLGAPVPASPFLVVVGALTVGGQISLPGAFIASMLANILGDGAWFLAGRSYGYRVLKLLCRISMSPDSCVRQSEAFITRWGGASLIAAKFLPGISVVAPPMAGALGMSNRAFLAFEGLAAAIWTLLFLGLGVGFSGQIQQILEVLTGMGKVALIALAVLLLIFAAQRYLRRRMFARDVAMARISVAELRDLMAQDPAPLVIDVRSAAGREIDPRRIPGALAVELDQVLRRSAEWPAGREIVLYCNCPNDASAARAAGLLARQGLTRVRPLAGGLDAWSEAGHPLERHEAAAGRATMAPHPTP